MTRLGLDSPYRAIALKLDLDELRDLPLRVPVRTTERLERELATEALAVWEAFCGFCEEEMGLSSEKVLQATFEDVRWFGDLCERLDLSSRTKRPWRSTRRI